MIEDVANIVATARETVDVEKRIVTIGHPDNPNVSVPVALIDHPNGGSSIALLTDTIAELDKRMPGPRRREGRVQLLEVASFCEYVARYQNGHSVVYANPQAMTFEAVIDEHPIITASDPPTQYTAWRGHRATYSCPRSPEWTAWTKYDGAEMKQEAFADFLEARLEDMGALGDYPKPIEMLQLARNLHIRTKGEFRRELNPTNGNYHMVNKTETDSGSTEIPRAFLLVIPVFEGGDRYQVEARVRFAIGESGPRFSYTLHRRAEIERDAFGGVRKIISEATKLPVLSGTP